jgi:DNA-binding CsgD family transcriptional regulator
MERRVVELVAEGLTNPEVGARLFVSRRTVETHLSHVFAKLGLTIRTQVAAEFVRRQSDSRQPSS